MLVKSPYDDQYNMLIAENSHDMSRDDFSCHDTSGPTSRTLCTELYVETNNN